MASSTHDVPAGRSQPGPGAPRLRSGSGPAPARLATLTSLRALAAFAVFTRHATETFFAVGDRSPLTRQGATGVSFFFILSGFVLTWSAGRADGAASFYRRRFARIYPAYIVVLLFTQVAVGTRDGFPLAPFLLNAGLVQSWVPRSSVFFGSDIGAWSLGCEAFFYLLFPLALPLLVRMAARRRWQLVAAFALADVVLAVAVHSPHQERGVGLWLVYILPVSRLGEFVTGMVMALAVRAGARPRLSLDAALLLALAAYVVAGVVPVYLMWVVVTFVPFCLLVATAAASDADGRPSWLRHRWLIRLGEWSYAFYLVHISVLTALHRVTGVTGGAKAALLMAAALVLSVGAAGLLFRFVERPMERRLRRDGRLPVSAGGSGHVVTA